MDLEQRRQALNEILVGILGSRNVYFQPPATLRMNYPAIVYSLSGMSAKRANNKLYSSKMLYTLLLINPSPGNSTHDKIMALPFCDFDRHYVAENLNHYVYKLYY